MLLSIGPFPGVLTINLLHHMAASECLRIRLDWPESVRGQMMLGALAPDAHTETDAFDRTSLHPEPGADVAAYVIAKLRPAGSAQSETMRAGGRGGERRAFALSVVAHIVGDEMARPAPYRMPQYAPTGFLPSGEPGALDLPAMRDDLVQALPRFALDPLTAEDIVAKREDALSRPPLADATGPHALVPELAEFLDMLVARTLTVAGGTPLLDVE